MGKVLKTALTALLVGWLPAAAGDTNSPVGPQQVAAAYFSAVEGSDLDAAGRLFARESSVFETGGVEGSWRSYRDHHLGPEIGQIISFEIDRKKPEATASEDGTLALVTWPIEYKIALKDERTIRSRGTVTFVLVREEGAYKIRHLHWSSRRMKPEP